MKKLLVVVLFFAGVSVMAQNVQLHYDFGDGRNFLTSTVEMFKPDKHGSSFFFIDMDYSKDGVGLAYWEISRDLKFWEAPVAFHAEYNGGFMLGDYNPANFNYNGFVFNDAWLAGASYSWNAEDFSKGFTFIANYKYIRNLHNASFQLTGVWYLNLLDNKISITGFADFWKEDVDYEFDGTVDTKFIFLSEPQVWYNATKNFSIGGELELANNFGLVKGFKARPTLAAKYTF